MKASRAVMIGAAALAVAGGGTAAAATIANGPVDSSGAIHGCWTNAELGGSHVFVLQDAGTACPKATTAISWNQTGPQGPAGATGATGPQGPQGPQGPAGTNGTNGANGNTILNGSGAPSNTLGHDGDFYLDTSADALYGPKTSGAWPASGVNLVGAAGPASPSGPTCSNPGPGANLVECAFYAYQLNTLDLTGANLSGANMASLFEAFHTNFTGANLTGANLENMYTQGMNLSGANLTNADFQYAWGGGDNVQGAIWNDTTCPDGTNSNNDGDTCVGHGL